MTDSATLTLEPAVHAAQGRLLSVNWFILMVLASGLLAYVLDLTPYAALPIEASIRAAFVVQIILVGLGLKLQAARLPGHSTLAIGLFGVSIAATFLSSAVGGADFVVVARGFYFMFNVGIFLLIFPLVPFRSAPGFVIPAFFLLCFGFGALQIYWQDLLLSDALRSQFGIEYDRFINGSIRATSFFASAPRFAECVVFASCFVLHKILARSGPVLVWVVLYGICLWLLLNTYSRSGYLLWIVSLLVLVVLSRRKLFGGRNLWALMFAWTVCIGAVVALILVLAPNGFEGIALGDASSLDARQIHWDELFSRLSQFDILTLLFGTGDAAMYSRTDLEYYVVDNVLLAVAEFSGIFGLAAFLVLFFSLFRAALKVSARHPGLNLRPVLAFFLALLVEGQFLDNHNTIFFTEFLILASISNARLGLGPARGAS